MTYSEMLIVAVLSSVCAFVVSTEEYVDVHAPASASKRTDVNGEAVAAASAPSQNVPAASRVHGPINSTRDRALVQDEAERTSAAPDQNVAVASRVNSRVISTKENPGGAHADAQVSASSRL